MKTFACFFPPAGFGGIDFSAQMIDEASRSVSELGLRNVRFEVADFLDFDPGGESSTMSSRTAC